ncbi:hypothetical protein [Desulfovibrio ferrophilus]|uniref:Cl-channel voltage-gated family protein n=1 Tax=Desulfovibrio ferrophilus TaxID=241368 RepID=A0A2Z6B218_9BACT|nr:hypothetical protein [Desulfovibrio ferrophilus]BBD09525.1 Cl- channel voltage-gated family protein [Desulfovibrio ferrophilus]
MDDLCAALMEFVDTDNGQITVVHTDDSNVILGSIHLSIILGRDTLG